MKKNVCRECGKELSSKASVCPNCGVKVHPIKDIVKIVVIVLGVLIGLFLICAIIINGSIFIGDKIQEKEYSKIIGTWELQNDNNKVEQNDIEMLFDKTITIKAINNCEPGDETCVIYDKVTFEDELIRKNIVYSYKNNNVKSNTLICYALDNDTLKQSPCPNNNGADDNISSQEMNIVYKKVN